MPSTPLSVRRSESITLAGERRGRVGAPAVVLLHANVADRRSWHGVLDALEGDDLDLVAYDRRGFGETPASDAEFTHLDDLLAVLDEAGIGRALLVGNSMGGAVALDLALTQPERVSGLLLLGPGVTGMTDEGEDSPYEVDPATGMLFGAVSEAQEEGDLDEAAEILVHIWLDGPTQPAGRVTGAARDLAVSMNRSIHEVAAPDEAGDSGPATWHRLGEIDVPALVTWGDLDIPADLPWYRATADRLPQAEARLLPGVAHLPGLEQPSLVAALVREQVRRTA